MTRDRGEAADEYTSHNLDFAKYIELQKFFSKTRTTRCNMLGHKVRDFKPLTAICLEDLVPADNFYRQVERSIDLSFVHNLADELYSSMGAYPCRSSTTHHLV